MKITQVYAPCDHNPTNWIEIGNDQHELIAQINGTHQGLKWGETVRYAKLFCASEEMLETLEYILEEVENTDGDSNIDLTLNAERIKYTVTNILKKVKS